MKTIQYTSCLIIHNLQRSRSISDPSTQKERNNNQIGLKRRPVAVKVLKAVKCPLCPVRVSADIFLLDHFCKKHVCYKEEPSIEFPVPSAERREAFKRIQRLFNKYAHTRETHRDRIYFVKQMETVWINIGTNACNSA